MREFKWGVSMCDSIDEYAVAQVENIIGKSSLKQAKIVMMPDVHPGNYTPIGFTARIKENHLTSLQPAILGTDIGCGVSTVQIEIPKKKFSFAKLDNVIKELCIQSTKEQASEYKLYDKVSDILDSLYCHIDQDRALETFGTLGGGNHFIEIDKDSEDRFYLSVHSGSRNLGAQIYNYYLDLASTFNTQVGKPRIDRCLSSKSLFEYIADVLFASTYAIHSRLAILSKIIENTKLSAVSDTISTIHNTIRKVDDEYIITKGAIYEKLNKDVIIPINARDGMLYGQIKNPKDWNSCLPHGAGRILKRSDVANHYTLSSYKKEMKEVYSSTISKATLDECPMAYRDIAYIQEALKDVMTIKDVWKPVYNFKNGSKE